MLLWAGPEVLLDVVVPEKVTFTLSSVEGQGDVDGATYGLRVRRENENY